MLLQGTLVAKYDFLQWSVVVWDGVTGSEVHIFSRLSSPPFFAQFILLVQEI